jgi:predicted nucleotidyltransferase
MAKYPESPESIFENYTNDWKAAFGSELQSIILYGSAARGEYVPGVSDINFLVMLSSEGIASLRKAFEVTSKWRSQNVAVPLVLSKVYIETSLDTFPIEFLSMQRHHKLIFGEDVLAGLEIHKANLRMQLEREVKGKLLHLRENFLAEAGDRDGLLKLLRQTLPAFNSMFEALLYLKGIQIPEHRRDAFMQAVEVAKLDKTFFDKLLKISQQESKPYRNELWDMFEKYISQIRALALFVDGMEKNNT